MDDEQPLDWEGRTPRVQRRRHEDRKSGGFGNPGIRVPGWAVVAVGVLWALLSFGRSVGSDEQSTKNTILNMDIRLCRIEQKLGVDPWPTCIGRGTQSMPTTLHAQ